MPVEVRGLKELARNLQAGHIPRLVTYLMEDLSDFIIDRAKELTPEWTGDLKDSYFHVISGEAAPEWSFIGSDLNYAPFVEFGTKPHWPPRAALMAWAASKGIPVFLVQRAIATRGTFGAFMFTKAVNDHISEIERLVERASNGIEMNIGTI